MSRLAFMAVWLVCGLVIQLRFGPPALDYWITGFFIGALAAALFVAVLNVFIRSNRLSADVIRERAKSIAYAKLRAGYPLAPEEKALLRLGDE